MFKLDTDEIKQLESDLKHFASRSLPFATKHTLNTFAWGSRKRALVQMPHQFTLRNKWTERSIMVHPTRSLRISQQESAVGSTQEYMAEQEFGSTEVAKGKHGVPIPTSYAAGQGHSKHRTRVVRAASRLARIQFRKTRGKNKKQRMVLAVRNAVATGRRHVFIDFGRRKGILKVIGGSKRVKRGWPGNARLEMVHDLTHKSVTTPASPWMEHATTLPPEFIHRTYKEALEFQINRMKSARR